MPMSALLSIKGLHIAAEGEEIVRGMDLEIARGEVHVIMGPNGSGKSTLVNSLMGYPAYSITQGTVSFKGKDLLAMEPHERARAGLFLAFQYPKEIAGVTLRDFLFAAYKAQFSARDPNAKQPSLLTFQQLLLVKAKELAMDPALIDRPVNQGFSGGEKKKAEVLQLSVLEPTLALLDETDSGLDIDALKAVAHGVDSMRSPERSFLLVTHYARILDCITPDYVHVMIDGKIVESGGMEIARKLETDGYAEHSKTE